MHCWSYVSAAGPYQANPGSVEANRLTGDAPLATRFSNGEAPHRRRSTGHCGRRRNASQATLHWSPGAVEATRLTDGAPLAPRLSGGETPDRRRPTGHQAQWGRSASQATARLAKGPVKEKRHTGDAPLATRPSGGEPPRRRCSTGHQASGGGAAHRRRSTCHQTQWRRSASWAMLHWPQGSVGANHLTGDAPVEATPCGANSERANSGHVGGPLISAIGWVVGEKIPHLSP